MIGDGFCDDEANDHGCNFDGGDCCGSCIVKSHCSQCICLQSDVDEQNITNPLVGDGYCNDETNNPNCNFDGGDCCGSCIVKSHCSECVCLQPDVDKQNITNPLVGDGYCNDETNNPNCNFDGGDCCGPCLNKEFCSECLCHLGNLC